MGRAYLMSLTPLVTPQNLLVITEETYI